MRTILIVNPASGESSLAPQENQEETYKQHEQEIVAALHAYNIELEVWHTTPDDPGSGLAKKAAAEGVDTVIAAGGDGTIHAVASGRWALSQWAQ